MRIGLLAVILFLAARSPAENPMKMHTNFENYFYASAGQIENTSANPGNANLGLAQSTAKMDLRGNLNWENQEERKFVLRPRFVGQNQQIQESNPNSYLTPTTGSVNLTDAYWQEVINSAWSSTLGLQVYQWGPGELLSPSNPIYQFQNNQRSTVYKEKGQGLIRLNRLVENWSYVFISEPLSNNEAPFQNAQSFNPKTLLKVERQGLENRSNYVGLVLGSEDAQNLFLGEYFNYGFAGSFSFYTDSKFFQVPKNYIPLTDAYGFTYFNTAPTQANVTHEIVDAGFRYEGDWDWRVEYVYNSVGWTQAQFQQAYRSTYTLSPYVLADGSNFASPGLQLYGQNYYYFSVRMPDLGPQKKYNMAIRYLVSGMDSSSAYQFDLDRSFSDSIEVFVEITGALGSKDTELNLAYQTLFSAGFKWVL